MSISVSSTDSNKSYKAGAVLHLTVTFDEAVAVTGAPQLLLATGGIDNAATYLSGSGTNTLTFGYTVRSGDSSADLDYTGVNALQLNGGTITAAGADVALALPAPGSAGSLGDNKAIVVDGIAPTVAIASSKSHLTVGESATITFSFSENTGSFTWADIVVSGGTLGPLSGGGAVYTATFTPTDDTNGGVASITVRDSSYADDAGNLGGPGTSPSITFDTRAPTLAITSSMPTLKAGETALITFTFSEDPGASFTSEHIDVSGGTLGALSGTGAVRSAIFTPTSGLDLSTASIKVPAGSYADAAGNVAGGDATLALVFDTRAPDAPDVPSLAASSDTGTVGDGITASTIQVIEGVAEAGAMLTLYDGAVELASVKADANGAWTFAAHLGKGEHVLNATQEDETGNVSPASDPFRLTVTASNPSPGPTPDPDPDPDPDTVTIVDGVPVTSSIVTLPGGVIGTKVQVPVITSAMAGADGFADIPLAASGGLTALLARLPVGYGLSSSGGSIAADGALAFLVASIKAATSGDQGHLTQGGSAFLQGASYGSLLVETVKPVSNGGAEGALVLTGANGSGNQATALVIDAGGLSSSAALTLSGIGFGAVIGSATVVAASGMILSGDGARQDMATHAGVGATLLAGGGDDILRFSAAPAAMPGAMPGSAAGHALTLEVPVETSATLHGGLGNDTAVFAGARGDYELAFHAGYVTVAAKDAPLSTAKVVNVEQLQFADGTVAVENDAGLATLAGMYGEVLGRQADLDGFAFWAGRHEAGADWGAIALELIASSEHGAKFDGNAAHDIGLLYAALLDRAADAGGLAFWQGAMEKGMSLEQVADAMVASNEMAGHQVAASGWDFSI